MNEQTLPIDLNETQALNLLHTLAAADPDYPKVAKRLARLALVSLPPAEQAVIAHATLEVIGEDSQRAPAMIALLNHPPPQRFDAGLLSAGLLVAVVFLLRTHIRIEGKARGLAFTIEHKPADSKALTALLNRLAAFLPTSH
ncbi:MAG: hypothetical protein GY807_18020 [Gammaproteobacteria bacterium]|nr:hypothetical protein [Gammaproteobacteria bacterium]